MVVCRPRALRGLAVEAYRASVRLPMSLSCCSPVPMNLPMPASYRLFACSSARAWARSEGRKLCQAYNRQVLYIIYIVHSMVALTAHDKKALTPSGGSTKNLQSTLDAKLDSTGHPLIGVSVRVALHVYSHSHSSTVVLYVHEQNYNTRQSCRTQNNEGTLRYPSQREDLSLRMQGTPDMLSTPTAQGYLVGLLAFRALSCEKADDQLP